MRLTKIKLAGFKSFVDPTTIPIPSNLVGIVGPNGCGKSNTIDAVRWVMGESSAKHLRGDSMADVIFNGSSSRKPVGQAAIELVFDNSEGRAGGQFAQYNEISVKRAVSRDGQSNYFMNGTRCRRRDITDLFLGTGLGPRSYSIIEQGMISRVIEAKPEELRSYFEEAAGISKYKERRRETENRIRHTRENLDRLNDLREELDKQLAHLQRQARTAERYKEYKEQERLMKAQLWTLRWQALDQQYTTQEKLINEGGTEAESLVAKQRAIEAQIETLRAQHHDKNEEFNAVQGRFYAHGSEIARVEQTIQHVKERRSRLETDLEQAERSYQEVLGHLENDKQKIEELRLTLEEDESIFEERREIQEASALLLAEAEQRMQDWQTEWEAFNQTAAEPSQTAQVERARMQQLEQQGNQLRQRQQRLEEELQGLSTDELAVEVEQLSEQQMIQEQQVTDLQSTLQAQQQQINQQRELNNSLNAKLDETRSRLQSLKGRQSSLQALQQAALGKRQGSVSEWLRGKGLNESRRLAQGIQVRNGWDRAVECVLGFNLEAVCVEGLDPVANLLGDLQHGTLALFDTQAAAPIATAEGAALLQHVESEWPLDGLLGGVKAAADLAQALAMRSGLAPHESVITKEGIWIGSGWLRVARDADEKAGVLHREQELKELVEELELLQQQADGLQQQQEQGRAEQRAVEETRDQQQRELNQINRQLGDIRSQLGARQARLEQRRSRMEHIAAEREELAQQQFKGNEEYESATQRINQALEQMDQLGKQRDSLSGQRDQLRDALVEARDKTRHNREAAHEIQLRLQSMRSTLQSTEQGLSRMQDQLAQLQARREELMTGLEGGDDLLLLKEELEEKLALRVQVEQELTEVRRQVESIDHNLRELSSERNQMEQRVQEHRNQLEKLRIAWQEMKVRRQTMLEKINETGHPLKQLFDEMPEHANETQWQQEVEQLEQRITRLGPINLAAISEYEEQSERKKHLDAQNDDLVEALNTLESAISKIDRETRTRFKETFDKVNGGLQKNFPKLFGGGHAYLELTGEDLLDTGVTVMARPPGKRNSTIHLLSGGEKAMTAVALVFSIFELNPAPFCMLDEVDAPLDEANVGRFCKMVKEMSEHVQFIFITHNKATMEMALQLNGVTMSEPGVSRLVAVDVQEAYELAAM